MRGSSGSTLSAGLWPSPDLWGSSQTWMERQLHRAGSCSCSRLIYTCHKVESQLWSDGFEGLQGQFDGVVLHQRVSVCTNRSGEGLKTPIFFLISIAWCVKVDAFECWKWHHSQRIYISNSLSLIWRRLGFISDLKNKSPLSQWLFGSLPSFSFLVAFLGQNTSWEKKTYIFSSQHWRVAPAKKSQGHSEGF